MLFTNLFYNKTPLPVFSRQGRSYAVPPCIILKARNAGLRFSYLVQKKNSRARTYGTGSAAFHRPATLCNASP